jgi:hypothetical protein
MIELRYNKSVTREQAFLFATIAPYPTNVCFLVTKELANVGCGFVFGRQK